MKLSVYLSALYIPLYKQNVFLTQTRNLHTYHYSKAFFLRNNISINMYLLSYFQNYNFFYKFGHTCGRCFAQHLAPSNENYCFFTQKFYTKKNYSTAVEIRGLRKLSVVFRRRRDNVVVEVGLPAAALIWPI